MHKVAVFARYTRSLGTLGVLLALTAFSGCGPKTATVKGKVTFNGQSVKVGTVAFYPEKGKPVDTQLEDGQFELKKVPVGPGVFTVDTTAAQGMMGAPPGMATNQPELPPDATEEQRKVYERAKEAQSKDPGADRMKGAIATPTIYKNSNSSTLKYTVTSGSQEHNLELTGDPPSQGPGGMMPPGMRPPGM